MGRSARTCLSTVYGIVAAPVLLATPGCSPQTAPQTAAPGSAVAVVQIEPVQERPNTLAAIPYDLPQAVQWERVMMVLSVAISADGQYIVDGKAIADDETLLQALREGHAAHPELRLVLAADSKVKFGHVIRVMDLAKQADIQHIAFGVSPSNQAAGSQRPTAQRARPLGGLNCPFPAASDKAKIDKATVVLRADVDANGRVTQTKLVTDPGHGFGQAAIECIKKTKFRPAQDDGGAATTDEVVLRLHFKR